MKKYCFDTSGISNPMETMPEDIHGSMWNWFCEFIRAGHVAVTTEIYDEMCHIQGMVGDCIRAHKAEMLLEINKGDWNWEGYVVIAAQLQNTHHDYISEYNGGSPRMVCLNDISIVALAKTLELPVVSMESLVTDLQSTKRRIPNVCALEGVPHRRFNEFLRAEHGKW